MSEFAPENRFYANQRRVEVDQINMQLASTESWRFCPSCHHMQNLEISQDVHPVCPRCGDGMWSDSAQKRTLLRFKQAIANSDDTQVRIDDSADDREPRFYVRQLMADFEAKDIRSAWQIKAGGIPFGFEFVSRVTFRDVNFGELSKPGDQFKVADKESTRPGFKVCRHCGKVQKSPRRRDDPPGQHHTFDCPAHGSEDPSNLIDCLYLYREFESEALRILVPFTRSGVDEEVVQSFMAALQLGLKKRFGGKVDHLRMVLQDEPGKDGGPRRFFVMLYDSVPGGTGYLEQLLAKDAGTLADVLRMALQAMNECSCNHDPEKDGCYRCVYQYRLGRSMALVSRDRGKQVLGELVEALDQLESVPTISDIYINPNFDSVLEARFIEALKRMGGTAGLAVMQLEIVVGNIICQPDVDALVNSANANLRFGSGVAGAIHTAAGPELEQYCRRYSPIDLGKAVVTPGFNLANPYIIHARAASYINDDHAERYLDMAVGQTLKVAKEAGIKTLAMPAIGTGVFKFPPELAASIIVRALLSRADEYPEITLVRVCVGNAQMKAIFQAALDEAGACR